MLICKYLGSFSTKHKDFSLFYILLSHCHKPNPHVPITASFHWNRCKLGMLHSPCFGAEEFSELSGLFVFSGVQVAVSLNPLCLAVLMCSRSRSWAGGHSGFTPRQHRQRSPQAPNVPLGAETLPLAVEAKWGCDLGAVLSSSAELLVLPSKGTVLCWRLVLIYFSFSQVLGSVPVLS